MKGLHLSEGIHAWLAQSVEHETLNLRVVGSSPTSGGANFPLAKWKCRPNYDTLIASIYSIYESQGNGFNPTKQLLCDEMEALAKL